MKWVDLYPIEKQLVHGLKQDKEAAFVVDIGGGRGHDLKDVKAKLGRPPGRLILQDLPETIATVDPSWMEGIEAMTYDFFTPQPVKGENI